MEPKVRTASKARKPGRPEGPTTSRRDILDVAELLFAELGYAGTALRDVARRANVTTAMIGYYFGSKQNLFRAVFLRRGTEVADTRRDALAALQAAARAPTVEELVTAFLSPSLRLRETAQGRAFLRLHSRLHMEPAEISYDLRRTVYDETTRAYAEAFLRVLPHLDGRAVYLRMSLMIGAYLYTFSDTSRLEELMPGKSAPSEPLFSLEDIVAYVSAGMRAEQPCQAHCHPTTPSTSDKT
jgi:AcrR family transcriptional regulator